MSSVIEMNALWLKRSSKSSIPSQYQAVFRSVAAGALAVVLCTMLSVVPLSILHLTLQNIFYPHQHCNTLLQCYTIPQQYNKCQNLHPFQHSVQKCLKDVILSMDTDPTSLVPFLSKNIFYPSLNR